ncbi:MAG: integrase core domain-containing protein [Chloroflexota bacterium]
MLIVQPDSLLRWHRMGFRLFGKRKSRTSSHKRKLPVETLDLIKQIARDNQLWCAERIKGELLKLDIRVSKRTIQKYMHQARKPTSQADKPNQNWAAFLHNHANQVWACDFLPVYDLFFSPMFIFFIIELGSRRLVHFGVTLSRTDEWTAQQLREATPWGRAQRFLIRDNDSKYGTSFARIVKANAMEVLRTPYKTPMSNAFCERFLGSVRRECLDHMLILREMHLHRLVKEYVQYCNLARPHQGIGQAIPKLAEQNRQKPPPVTAVANTANGRVISFPVLEGLHHDYRRVA